MPLYEYKCEKCGKVFEIIQRFSDQPLTVHEGCGGTVERLISRSAIKFKGSGFYINDYAKSGSGGSSDKKSSESAESSGKSEAKSDGKTESKSERKSESKAESSKPDSKPSTPAPASKE